MDEGLLRSLLESVRDSARTPEDAVELLKHLPYEDLGFARVDHHRALRQGMAEAVYAPGKSVVQCSEIVAELLSRPGIDPVLLTRADDDRAEATQVRNPGGVRTGSTVAWRSRPAGEKVQQVVLVTGGTSDLAVADECGAVLRAHGFVPLRVNDVGVAGLHRLVDSLDDLASADAVVVFAGMEGALASVVGGLTPAPVVAVPTSVGYGSSFEGMTALLAMLASCASGITVVGIDNGFGAACAVNRMFASQVHRPPTGSLDASVMTEGVS